MAGYEHLPGYKAALDLTVHFERLRPVADGADFLGCIVRPLYL